MSHPLQFKLSLRLCLIIMLVAGALTLQPRPAHAATITVDSLLDPTDPGHTTLQDAITTANLASGDTITFSVTGTITLTNTLPDISSNTTISGPGAASLAIDGAKTYQIMVVDPGATLTLSGVTLQNGHDAFANGGGIYNQGTLTLTNSTLSGNSASFSGGAIENSGTLNVSSSTFSANSASFSGGAIENSGTLNVSNSTFSANTAKINGGGGGIYNSGTLTTVSNSTFSGNTASDGGGIYNQGTLTLTNSTLSSNFTSNTGGGIFNSGGTLTLTNSTLSSNLATFGGGINNFGGLTLTKSTLSGNFATFGGGGVANNGTLTMTNSTFSSNIASDGGGINNAGTVTVTNSTLSGNFATTGGGINTVAGVVTLTNSIVANSISGGNCSGGGYTTTGANLSSDASCTGFTLQNTNPQLGGLTGTPGVLPLLAGSKAIDAAPSCSVTTDERGVSRPQGSACDLGAYEYVPVVASTQSPMCNVLGFPNTGLVQAVVPPGIATTGNIPVTICYGILTDSTQIGVLNHPITLAVEVVAYTQTQTPESVAPLLQPLTICLSGSGTLLYRDATGAPRVVTTLSAFSNGGFTCATIPDAGTVILAPGPAAPAGSLSAVSAPSVPSHTLSACSVKTLDILNLHEAADVNSTVMAQIPTGTSLYATARAGDWIKVIYTNTQGWLAVRFLALDGQCD